MKSNDPVISMDCTVDGDLESVALKASTFANPELVKVAEEGAASERVAKRRAAKKKAAADPHKQAVAAAKARAQADLAKMQLGKW